MFKLIKKHKHRDKCNNRSRGKGRGRHKQSTGHIENNLDKCIYCGVCEKSCPFNAINVNRKTKSWSIDNNACRRCTKCVMKCPKNALTFVKSNHN